MKFIINTLVDITETGARRGEERVLLDQQQNFLTFLQTLGLRVNPTVTKSPVVTEQSIKDMGFGTRYKGKHRVWTFEFAVEYKEALTVDMLLKDFDLVPIITNLSETADIKQRAFRTDESKECNITFHTQSG